MDGTRPQSDRQRYLCHGCRKRFEDLTDTIFAGHHQPLRVWVLCLYFMGLNLSNEPIAQELGIDPDDAQIQRGGEVVIRRPPGRVGLRPRDGLPCQGRVRPG
jgi:transposase-like protein